MTGSLKNTIEGIMKSSSVLKKSEDSLCVEYLINEKSDYVNMYKNIVANLDASTLVNPGFYIRAMVGMGNKLSDTPQNATLAEAKNLISNDAQNHRSLYIYWQCGHVYDSSRWQLTSAATCQHNNQYRCTICGETKSEGNTISHNYSSCILGATCQNPAVYKCTMCNSTINQGRTIGHNYSTYVSGATCQHPQYISALCAAIQLIQEGMQIIHGHRKVRQPVRRDRCYTVRLVGHRRQVQGQQDIIIQVFQ